MSPSPASHPPPPSPPVGPGGAGGALAHIDLYTANVIGLVTINAVLSYLQWRTRRVQRRRESVVGKDGERNGGVVGAANGSAAGGGDGGAGAGAARTGKGRGPKAEADAARYAEFRKRFLGVYLLVFGADWLQGPYIYPLYKDEKALSEETVAHLFTTGFLGAAISATFVGSIADQYGRRFACRAFCILYSISCATTFFDNIIILFIGRILGGVSSTLMYSVFESWMVTEYHRQGLDQTSSGTGTLNDLFGLMTTLNSIVAIVAGLFAQAISDATGTHKSPFLTAVGFLMAAFWAISKYWGENYGDTTDHSNTLLSSNEQSEKGGLRLIKEDKRLWALTITTCFFEGSMYLWIFFKFPALRLAHQLEGKGSDLPFGMIFAALMCAMMLGSIFFTWYSSLPPTSRFVVPPSTLLSLSLMVAAWCFLIPVLVRDEEITFWCFCVFEMCVGIYFPTMGNLKEKVVDDGVRAKIYGAFRVPLNFFVVLGLGLTKDGESHRDNMFKVCGAALITAGVVVGKYLRD